MLLHHRCFDVTVVNPLHADTVVWRRHPKALTFRYNTKMAESDKVHRTKEIAFHPVVLKSLGGFHPVVSREVQKLVSGKPSIPNSTSVADIFHNCYTFFCSGREGGGSGQLLTTL